MKRTELSYIYGSDVSEMCDDDTREAVGNAFMHFDKKQGSRHKAE